MEAQNQSVRTTRTFSYTVTDGLPMECVEKLETIMNLGPVNQKMSRTTKRVFAWKELSQSEKFQYK